MTDISIFDGEHRLIIDKPLRLIELFAGYGSQSLALKYLGIPHEHYFISEWAVKSIQAYKDMHCHDDDHPYDTAFSDKEIKDYLKGKISADYSTPLTDEQIDRMPIDKARTIVRNMFATNNQGSICSIDAKKHPIVGDYTYLLTYSFPCQDLSMAGLRQGMERGSSTRSGLLWEVERLLNEWHDIGRVPDILLMENVPEVVGTKNRKAWEEWIASLDWLGYKSYWKILNATDYGIPQNRRRCFMVSAQGNYYYDHPSPIGCPLRLKDVLENKVSEDYYLSDETVAKFVRSQSVNAERERENDGNPDAGWLDDREIDSRGDNLRGSQERTECEMQRRDQRNSRTAVVKKGDPNIHPTEIGIALRARDYKTCKTVDTREGINAVVETNSD